MNGRLRGVFEQGEAFFRGSIWQTTIGMKLHRGPSPARDLAWIFHTQVAADVSRRHLGCGKSAPTDVSGYALSVNRAV
jgi:hypothetical protein